MATQVLFTISMMLFYLRAGMVKKVSAFRFVSLLLGTVLSTSCASTKLVKDYEETIPREPVATHRGHTIKVDLSWVLLRNGPGSWATNAEWDEYVLAVRNTSNRPVNIVDIGIVDSLGSRFEPSSNREWLVKESRDNLKRYEEFNIDVQPGVASSTLATIAVATGVIGAQVAMTTLVGSAALSSGSIAVATGGLLLAPVLAVSALASGTHERRVAREINNRATPLPIELAPGQSQKLDVFFPVTPSPTEIEISVRYQGGGELVVIDTTELLKGQHLKPADAAK